MSLSDNRVLVPMYDVNGQRIAWNARAYEWIAPFSGPKTYLYYDNSDALFLDFRTHGELFPDGGVILVEDSLSAIRLHQEGWNCVSLNGTHLSDEGVQHLINLGVDSVLVWLDQDANAKSKKLARQYGLVFDWIESFQQPPTTPDPKSMETEQLVDVMENLFDGRIKRTTTKAV